MASSVHQTRMIYGVPFESSGILLLRWHSLEAHKGDNGGEVQERRMVLIMLLLLLYELTYMYEQDLLCKLLIQLTLNNGINCNDKIYQDTSYNVGKGKLMTLKCFLFLYHIVGSLVCVIVVRVVKLLSRCLGFHGVQSIISNFATHVLHIVAPIPLQLEFWFFLLILSYEQ